MLNRNLLGGTVSSFSSLLQLEAQELARGRTHEGLLHVCRCRDWWGWPRWPVPSPAPAASLGTLHMATSSTAPHPATAFPPVWSLLDKLRWQARSWCSTVGICHGSAGPTGNVPAALNSKHILWAGHQSRLWALVTSATKLPPVPTRGLASEPVASFTVFLSFQEHSR